MSGYRALAPRMIGRQAQLRELNEHLDLARSGAGRVVFVVGEAGVGKTRLLREFARGTRAGASAPHSLVLILEDLHWSDQSSQGLLAHLARAIERDPVLVLASYRVDELH